MTKILQSNFTSISIVTSNLYSISCQKSQQHKNQNTKNQRSTFFLYLYYKSFTIQFPFPFNCNNSNFNSIFLKQKMQIQMQTCFIKKYLNFSQKGMTNLRNFVSFKLKISLKVIKTYTDKTKQSINKSTLNNSGKDNSKIKKFHNLRTQNLNILSFKNSII